MISKMKQWSRTVILVIILAMALMLLFRGLRFYLSAGIA